MNALFTLCLYNTVTGVQIVNQDRGYGHQMGDDRSLPRMAMAFGCALPQFDSFSKLGRRVNFRTGCFSDLIKSTNSKLLLLCLPKDLSV